jgi:hypothetical protein
MKPQYQHKVMTSFLLWFDNYLIQEGQAYSNKTGTLLEIEDTRLPTGFTRFASPYKQWVSDSSITGESGAANPTIPAVINKVGVGNVNRENGRYVFDFENGSIIATGTNGAGGIQAGDTVTASFSVKDFNIYLTNETEEDLILESKFKSNSRYDLNFNSGVKPYDQMTPAIFINNEETNNAPFAFGGEDETRMSIKAVVMAEDTYSLDGVLSIFADSTRKSITAIPFTGHPGTEYGDIDGGHYAYTGITNRYEGSETKFYINDVTVSKLSDRAKKQSIGDLKIGFIDFDLHQHRFPRL